jgi:hypothetical protein
MSAVGLVDEMVDSTRVSGKRLFVRPPGEVGSSIDAYVRSARATEQPTGFVLAAKSIVREVDRTLKRISVSTMEDAGRALPLLAGLEHRVRAMRPGAINPEDTRPLDRLA